MFHSCATRCSKLTAFFLAALLAATVLACSSCGTASFSKEEKARLDKAITDYMNAHHFPGVVVGAWVPGKGTYLVAKGRADLKTGAPMRVEDKFGAGSVTKSMVGTVLLQLVDEGKLKLDNKVSQYFPTVPNGQNITVRQLLNMTSGLYNYTEDKDFLAAVTANPRRKWAPEELVKFGISKDPYFAPGKGWYYCNTNTILVGLLIEKLTGKKLEDEVKTRIIDRLGLANTTFPENPGITAPYAHGYMYDQETKQYAETDSTQIDPSALWAAGALISNVPDLKVWAQALGSGRLISKAMQKERTQFVDQVPPLPSGIPETADGMDPGYGLAIVKYDNTNNFIGITGRTTSWDNQTFYLPSEKAVLVVFANTNTTTGDGPLFFATVSKVVFPGSFPKVK
jgi:D-alanyl-D-alanine carboxypeptidase